MSDIVIAGIKNKRKVICEKKSWQETSFFVVFRDCVDSRILICILNEGIVSIFCVRVFLHEFNSVMFSG